LPVNIHPQAIVSPQAKLSRTVSVGPFCIIEPNVVIGDGCTLAARVVVKSGTTIGPNNHIFEGAVLGGIPQHTRPPAQFGGLRIGANNTVRENCTIHRALHEGAETTVGEHNYLMVGVHIAHDCHVGNHTIFANNALLAGHVTVGDRAFISGAVAVHQFCRIGQLAMVGGHARVVQDVPPFMMIDGVTGYVVGLNLVGLRRNAFTTEQVCDLKAAYRLIYRSGLKWTEVLDQLKRNHKTGPAAELLPFLSQGTRGFVQERRMPPNATLKLRRASDEEGGQTLQVKAG
jgi:UDP-N-acetylglucosamine acyltransferase